MSVGYRSILRLEDSQDAIHTAESHLTAWLVEKKSRGAVFTVDWDGPGTFQVGATAVLDVTYVDRAEDLSRRRLYRFEETNPVGTWIVSIFAISLPSARDHKQSLVVEAALQDASAMESVERVDPPRVVRSILETTRAWDGRTQLFGVPQIVRNGGVDEVIDAILDPQRKSAVVVAASLGAGSDERWTQVVGSLTKDSVGVASTFVVYADGMSELDDRLPDSHRVDPGRVRTFAPLVDIDDPDDGLRHRILGPATLSRSMTGYRVARPLIKVHAAAARRRLVEQDLPTDLRRGVDLLRKAAVTQARLSRVTRLVAETLPTPVEYAAADFGEGDVANLAKTAPAPAVVGEETTPTIGALHRLRGLVRKWFGRDNADDRDIDEIDELLTLKVTEVAVAEQQLEEAANDQLRIEGELRAANSRLEELDLVLALTAADARGLERESQQLRQRLILAERAEDTYVEPEANEWEAPTSIEELVARITKGDGVHLANARVEFVGDLGKAIEVDKRDPHGRYAAAIWDYIHVLYDYAALRTGSGFAGGVHAYLTDDSAPGHKCSKDRHAGTESESVLSNRSWREERVFDVPVSVDATGRTLMSAHFKPTHRDTFAPRVHYFDDTARSGRIFIGYIGRHLSNTKS